MQQTIGQGVKPFIEIITHPLKNSCQIYCNKQSDKELSHLLRFQRILLIIAVKYNVTNNRTRS
jgi:hypothetical protein